MYNLKLSSKVVHEIILIILFLKSEVPIASWAPAMGQQPVVVEEVRRAPSYRSANWKSSAVDFKEDGFKLSSSWIFFVMEKCNVHISAEVESPSIACCVQASSWLSLLSTVRPPEQ